MLFIGKRTKRCTKCGEVKPLDAFHVRTASKDGRTSACKECELAPYRAQSVAWQQRAELTARGMKRCAKCGEAKPFEEFPRDARKKDGRRSRCKACRAEYRRQHPGMPGTSRRLRRKYGIALTEYDDLLEIQGNGCAICGMSPEENGRRLAVDHNHEMGEVRGLLCTNCNLGIGNFRDDPSLTSKATDYLLLEQE